MIWPFLTPVLQCWYIETFPLPSRKVKGCVSIRDAVQYGRLDLVKWFYMKNCTVKNAIDYAGEYGHLEIVKWLHENRTEGCTTYAMDYAAEYGHMGIVKWLREHDIVNHGKVVVPYQQCVVKDPKKMCPICHSNLDPGETIATTNCNHDFHIPCLEQWLEFKKNCPMCRTKL